MVDCGALVHSDASTLQSCIRKAGYGTHILMMFNCVFLIMPNYPFRKISDWEAVGVPGVAGGAGSVAQSSKCAL